MSKSKKKQPSKAAKPSKKSAPKKASSKPKPKLSHAMQASLKAAAEATEPAKAPKASNANTAEKPKRQTKLGDVILMLQRPEGATIEDIMQATNWQQHTVRSTITHAIGKKRGYDVVSSKPENGARIYKIVTPEQ